MKQSFIHTNAKGLTEVEYDVQVQKIESVKGSKSPMSGMYLAEQKKGKSYRSNTLKSVRVLKSTEVKNMKDSEWLEIAEAGEDDSRESIAKAHKNWAADGFRLHLIEGKKECDCKYCKNRENGKSPMSPDYKCLFPARFNGEVTMSRNDILSACDQNKAFQVYNNCMKWLVKSDLVEISVENKEIGSGFSTFEDISQSGIEILFGLNSNFVKDAVKGMDKKVTVKYQARTAPILITDGKRTALLMPINIG